MSPFTSINSYTYMFYVGPSGFLSSFIHSDFYIIPAISLKSNVIISEGDGSNVNPYVIE